MSHYLSGSDLSQRRGIKKYTAAVFLGFFFHSQLQLLVITLLQHWDSFLFRHSGLFGFSSVAALRYSMDSNKVAG